MSFTDRELLAEQTRLFKYCVSLTQSQDKAEDLCQTTLMKALQHKDHFVPGSNLPGWLGTIARNTYFQVYKREKRIGYYDPDALSGMSPAIAPDMDSRLELQDVLERIRLLPESYQQVLAHIDLSYEDAAQALGVAVGTIKSRLARARISLKKLMDAPPEPVKEKEEDPVCMVVPSIPAPVPALDTDINDIIDVPAESAPVNAAPTATPHIPSADKWFVESDIAKRLQISKAKLHKILCRQEETLPVKAVFSTQSQEYKIHADSVAALSRIFRYATAKKYDVPILDALKGRGIKDESITKITKELTAIRAHYAYVPLGRKTIFLEKAYIADEHRVDFVISEGRINKLFPLLAP